MTTPAFVDFLSQERLGPRKYYDLDDFEGLGNGFESFDSDFEGLGPSNRTILGKRQPLFFTPREKLTSNLTIFEALARLGTRFRDLGGREKAGYVFLAIFLSFLGTLRPFQGPVGEGRLKEGERGRSDRPLKNPKHGSFRFRWSKIKLGNFTHPQNEENWIDF